MYESSIHAKGIFTFNMSEADRKEVVCATGKPPYDTLAASLEASKHAWVFSVGGLPIAYVGFVIDEQGFGIPWMLASDFAYDSVDKNTICTYAWSAIDVMFMRVDALQNFVSKDHKKAIRWLKFLGFSFDETMYILDDPDQEFYRFYWVKDKQDV